jgi:hypothetical protein
MSEQPNLFEEADRLATKRRQQDADNQALSKQVLQTGWIANTDSSQVAEAPALWRFINPPPGWTVNPAHPLADGLVAYSFGTSTQIPRVRGGA